MPDRAATTFAIPAAAVIVCGGIGAFAVPALADGSPLVGGLLGAGMGVVIAGAWIFIAAGGSGAAPRKAVAEAPPERKRAGYDDVLMEGMSHDRPLGEQTLFFRDTGIAAEPEKPATVEVKRKSSLESAVDENDAPVRLD